METKREFERRCKLSLDQYPVHVRWQGASTKLSPIQTAEYNGCPWKDQVSIRHQEIKGRCHDGDCDVDLLVRIFCTKEVSQNRLVRVRAKSRQIHRFAIDLDWLGGVEPECVDELRFQERQARQFDPFVKKQNDMPRCGRRRQTVSDRHDQARARN